MSVDLVSRTTGHLTCLYMLTIFATCLSLALNATALKASPNCSKARCMATIATTAKLENGLNDPAHIRAVAAVLWAKKI